MWNQGNGNGYGYGQGYGQQEDVYGRLNNTRELGGVRLPFIDAGKHRFAVVTIEEFDGRRQGEPKVRIVLRTMESQKHKPGELVVRILNICEPPAFPDGISDGELFADFVRKLKGVPPKMPIADKLRDLMKHRVTEQLARGIMIDCLGVPNKKGNWVNLYWTHVEGQTPEQIVALRKQIEAEGIPPTGGTATRGIPGTTQSAPPQAQPGTYYPQHGGQTPAPGQYGTPNAPQGVPPGGYLASVPVNTGNGNQGGNQGGVW